MQRTYYSPETDGFYGAYYPCPTIADKAVICMLGDSIDDRMATSGVKWLHRQGVNVLTMAPAKNDYGHHDYPLERFGAAITLLRREGNRRVGVAGASTTGMLALLAASHYPEITLTIAMCPCDFVMGGFYQDGLDGAHERPSGGSSVSWQGKPLPHLPYAWEHPEYWQRIRAESKATGNMIASRALFDESEKRHPLTEAEMIPVERIQGRLLLVGAEDDALWDTCRYIRRIQQRLSERGHSCALEALTYEHGTHFVFPEGMLKIMLPVLSGLLVRFAFKAAREHPAQCRQTRLDIEQRLTEALARW